MDYDAILTIDGNELRFGVPFVKVNTEKRIVEGFATLDNVDKLGDVVDFDASKQAFAEWPGNIREMHQKIAVGKAVSILEKQMDIDGKTYNGIWVKARISKGAQDTWEKVLDGTLSGFSVGGAIQEFTHEMNKDLGKNVRRVTRYRLTELSLVDNPANQLSNISLIKDASGTEILDDIEEDEEFEKRDFSAKERDKAADDGAALPDGSFPIYNQNDLDNAVRLVGNASDPAKAKAHIVARAKKLGLKLPEGWGKMEKSDYEQIVAEFQKDYDMSYSMDGICKGSGCDMGEDGHLQKSMDHLQAASAHAASAEDYSAAAEHLYAAGNLRHLRNQAKVKQVALNKGEEVENLHNNENPDNSILDTISENDRNLLQKFLDFVKGIDRQETTEEETPVEKSDETIENKEGDTPEMNEEMLAKALGEVTDTLVKALDEKLGTVGEKITAVEQRFETVATTDSVDELKKSLDEVTGRVAELENSGALKKSNEAAGAEEKLEKSDEGLWSDSIVPTILKDRFAR